MAQQITIGGDRVGSGKKMKGYLNDYNRSTHNLSGKFASSVAPGVLYPCLVKPVMRGDSFDITIQADARTLPTMGALFGSFKMQTDLYFCPLRLYQALLHNNPLAIGLNASQVKLPLMQIINTLSASGTTNRANTKKQFSNSSLLKYLGLSGIGTCERLTQGEVDKWWGRYFNAVPMLAYYDIFKNYYANKQEEKAYVISESNETLETGSTIEQVLYTFDKGFSGQESGRLTETQLSEEETIEIPNGTELGILQIQGEDLNDTIKLILEGNEHEITYWKDRGYITINKIEPTEIVLTFFMSPLWANITTIGLKDATGTVRTQVDLIPFDLKNIDDMRYDILSYHNLGEHFIIQIREDGDDNWEYPYKAIVGRCGSNAYGDRANLNTNPMNGLVVKTYQNDMFNNWLNTEWIEGENGINEITKVEVVDGAFSMDALNFAQKLYNMLNRVAVAGGTYEDWQDVMYENIQRRHLESPVYLGGMSKEIYFDEVIQTAPAEGEPLGNIGGRGRLSGEQKGGKVHVKIDEAGFLIGIVSLTPRIFQTQGNEFYMTELESLDDFHKPGLDGIGFQDLLGERMAYFDTKIEGNVVTHRSKIGKLPAWIDYMTSVDRAYGDFADTEGRGYMILNRNYEEDEDTHTIADATTYIDPSKYNYAFADASLTAQNFWLEILFNIKARRLMSARIIPNV